MTSFGELFGGNIGVNDFKIDWFWDLEVIKVKQKQIWCQR